MLWLKYLKLPTASEGLYPHPLLPGILSWVSPSLPHNHLSYLLRHYQWFSVYLNVLWKFACLVDCWWQLTIGTKIQITAKIKALSIKYRIIIIATCSAYTLFCTTRKPINTWCTSTNISDWLFSCEARKPIN